MGKITKIAHFTFDAANRTAPETKKAMGIKTLLPYLRDVTRKAKLDEFKGQTAAVDASCVLHRALSISFSRNGDDSRLRDLLKNYVDLLERNEIKPYVVFDGLRLPAKEHEREKRTKRREETRSKANELRDKGEVMAANKLLAGATSITYAMTTEFIKLCRDKNIDYIVAPYEADAQIAYIVKNGQADFAISEDSDLLAFGCKKVLFKMQMNGECDCIELNQALEHLGMTQTNFLEMCMVAGCDYLPNIRGIGINRAKKLVAEETDLMKALLNMKHVPEGYESKFLEAKFVFLHQTVINTNTMETVPLSEWRDTSVTSTQKVLCGNLLSKVKSLNVAIGNVNPEEQEVILKTFPLPIQNSTRSFDEASAVSNVNKEYNKGKFCCTSHCTIRVNNEELTVLWMLSSLKSTPKPVACALVESDNEENDSYTGEHTLPFKVMGTCYWTSRQDALEEAYEYLHEYNQPVFAKLVEEPENLNDNNAIAVYVMASDEYKKVGYIARELTTYLKPIMKSLDVEVKHIRFSTTFSTIGYYLTIEITKKGRWHKDVVEASKKVK